MQPAAAAFYPPPPAAAAVAPSAATPPAAPAPDSARKAAREQAGGVKDTIESILVAFILAFVFRAFVVEAFVIPTGSMATTLLGAHTRYHCPDCGYDFTMNYQSPGNRGDDEDLNTPATAGRIGFPVYCPNCGCEVGPAQRANPVVYYGDRILVLKYRYLLQKPRRWDVVVFKAPVKPRFPGTNRVIDLPPRYDTNYIKRLIGTPGEQVLVLDGDVYVREPGEPADHFTVQPKPRDVQDAMWRLVYDNDYHPENHVDRNGAEWAQPWKAVAGTGWDTADPAGGGRRFTFDNAVGDARLEFDAAANPTAQGLSDYLVHNQSAQVQGVPPRSPSAAENHRTDIPVSDVDLRLTYERLAGAGPLTLTVTKRDHAFVAVVTPTTATLFHDLGGHRTQVGVPFPMPAGDRPVRLELADADYRVTLRVDDADAAQTTPAEFAPDLPALLREFEDGSPPPPTVAVSAARQRARLSHLSLWRDVYYYNNPRKAGGLTWATPTNFPSSAQQLGPDEYFVMGDNSQLSSDARYWTDTVSLPAEHLTADAGRVPGRFLLGKAFYVYWPAGYKAVGWLPAFVPNFGAMRFIH